MQRFVSLALALLVAFFAGLMLHFSLHDPEAPVSQSVTEEGGEILGLGGRVRLLVPPGAVSGELDVTIEEVEDQRLGHFETPPYDLGPGGTTFDEPVTLIIRLDRPHAADRVFLAELHNDVPVEVPGSRYDPDTREVSAPLRYFSRYVAVSNTRALSACEFCVKRSCSDPIEACEKNALCVPIPKCIDACVLGHRTLPFCAKTCAARYPTGERFFAPVLTCAELRCPSCAD